MATAVILDKSAAKALQDLQRGNRAAHDAILKALEGLEADPTPLSAVRLKGSLAPRLRVRCGDYRIVYLLTAAGVRVVLINHRKDVYR